MKSIKIFLTLIYSIIFTILWIVIIQDFSGVIKEPNLNGDVQISADTSFSLRGWLNGDYQKVKENYLNDNFGMHNTIIRINNQLDFSLFKKANAKEVVVGVNNYLYEKSYIENYNGKNYEGDKYHQELAETLKLISDTLTKLNKTFLIVIAPGKASFYPEYIPEEMVMKPQKSNYDGFIEHIKAYPELDVIDFRAHFNSLKKNSKYPLYPKFGIHWSMYGSYLAQDSIIRYIENKRSVKLRKIYAASFDLEQAHDIDYDIGDGMNLLFPVGEDILAYANYKFTEYPDFVKPNLLVIGDSFYWNIYRNLRTSFNRSTFLYYNQAAYVSNVKQELVVNEEFTKTEIEKTDVVMIIVTEAKIESLGWGFLNNTRNIYKLGNNNDNAFVTDSEIKTVIQEINSNSEWSTSIRNKAKIRGVSYEQALYDDAKWFLENKKRAADTKNN